MGEEAIRYLVIEPHGMVTEHTIPLPAKKVIEIIGGPFQSVASPTGAVVFYPYRGGERNWLATQWMRSRLHPDDRIGGTAVVTGPPNDDGEVTNLRDEDLVELTRLFEAHTGLKA